MRNLLKGAAVAVTIASHEGSLQSPAMGGEAGAPYLFISESRASPGETAACSLPRPLCRVRENPGTSLKKFPPNGRDNPYSTVTTPGPKGTGIVFKRSCRWLAKVTAVGTGTGRLRSNEQDRPSPASPFHGPTFLVRARSITGFGHHRPNRLRAMTIRCTSEVPS